uniref:Uncharacterized protein n=1 Tax=Timema bartmani TaxID=61472 RepID=A0A7R9EQJ2_9NEOP|nr:unnamed protein product [Timema bartmani]
MRPRLGVWKRVDDESSSSSYSCPLIVNVSVLLLSLASPDESSLIAPVALASELKSRSPSAPQRAPRASGLHLGHPSSLLEPWRPAHSPPPAKTCMWDSHTTPRSELLNSAGTSGEIVSPLGTRPSRGRRHRTHN